MAVKKAKVRLHPLSLKYASPRCTKASLIATTSHAAADALLDAFHLAKEKRGAARGGMTTDAEQDLLRSMLVMTAAGLDATVKQLIEDTLPTLINCDPKAQNSFEKFAQRRLGSDGSGTGGANIRLLASLLASASPQTRLIDEYVGHLTSGSLQSTDSLFEVAAALGIDPTQVGLLAHDLRPIFDTRNKIIHELDINLHAKRRTRNVRTQANMIDNVDRLFRLIRLMVQSVDGRLTHHEKGKS